MLEIPTTAKEYNAWLETVRAVLTPEQLFQAEYVEQSFKGLAMSKNKPEALESAQRTHDAAMEKLKTLLAGN